MFSFIISSFTAKVPVSGVVRLSCPFQCSARPFRRSFSFRGASGSERPWEKRVSSVGVSVENFSFTPFLSVRAPAS